jgi:hypothetical protein
VLAVNEEGGERGKAVSGRLPAIERQHF